MNDIQRADAQIVKELARDARSLKDDRAFMAAVGVLKKEWTGEFMNCQPERLLEVRSKLRVLESIMQMLDHLIASGGLHGGR